MDYVGRSESAKSLAEAALCKTCRESSHCPSFRRSAPGRLLGHLSLSPANNAKEEYPTRPCRVRELPERVEGRPIIAS